MIKFDCRGFFDNGKKTWRGYISKLVYFGSHMEISILLDNPVVADIYKTPPGFFVYFHYYEVGLNLSSLLDIDENVDRLSTVFGIKDAATVAHAIQKVGNLLSTPKPRRRRASKTIAVELPF